MDNNKEESSLKKPAAWNLSGLEKTKHRRSVRDDRTSLAVNIMIYISKSP